MGVGVIVLRGNDVLLVRRGAPPLKNQWSIPGGKQERGETVRDAAHREIREETGVEIALIGLVDVVDGIRRDNTGAAVSHYTLIDFAAEWVSGEAVAGDDAAEARWIPLNKLSDYRLWSETRRVIAAAAAMRDDARDRKAGSP
ncbi:MAG: NUDIX hydrolase [Alphaproteobacteria bacterium]|nr:NUDIX hydrolase [Alphaproteobacteria bacterium]MCY4318887.1 NUDIX hydrolase [Alphaproteobacteria bacterium]